MEMMNAAEFDECYLVLGLPTGIEGANLSKNEIRKAYVSKYSELKLRRTSGDPNTGEESKKVEFSYKILNNAAFRDYHRVLVEIEMKNLELEKLKASGSSSRPKEDGMVIHLLFEFACGYALFYAHRFNEIDPGKFESAEEYTTLSESLILEDFHQFSSDHDSIMEMNAISKLIVTEQLKNFLLKNVPKPGKTKNLHYVATWDVAFFAPNIKKATGLLVCGGELFLNMTRALRMNIDKLLDLQPGHSEQAQLNLARLCNKQRCITYVKSARSVPSTLKVAVVPHSRFEGLFIAKDIKDFIFTKNLVCGEALRSEDLFVRNEDEIKVEYRVWNPSKSKLAAAIICEVTNIWIKPGSRVLYLGDVCGITVSQLSNLVGSDGLVYVVGLCNDLVNIDLVKIAEKRSNVVTIFENPSMFEKYRMVVGMVDVMFAEMDGSCEVDDIVQNARFYLRTGGHYMIATQARNTNLTSLDREFKQIELVKLKPINGAYVMAVGSFRMPED